MADAGRDGARQPGLEGRRVGWYPGRQFMKLMAGRKKMRFTIYIELGGQDTGKYQSESWSKTSPLLPRDRSSLS